MKSPAVVAPDSVSSFPYIALDAAWFALANMMPSADATVACRVAMQHIVVEVHAVGLCEIGRMSSRLVDIIDSS